VISHTSSSNLWPIRVHGFVAREISVLQSENLSLWVSTSSMQPLQADVEHPRKETRSQALAKRARFVASRFGTRTLLEESGAAHWPYAASHGTPLASGHAAFCVPTSGVALAKRALGFGLGRTLFPLSRKRLGVVCDGDQAVPSKPRRLPRSCAPDWQREHAGLVSGIQNHSPLHSPTHPGLGLRRGFGNYQAGYQPGLDRAALPFPSHQQIAKRPGPAKPQLGRPSPARKALSTYPQSARSPRRIPFANRAQKAQPSRWPSLRLRVIRMIVREFLRRIDHFRAYRKYPKLHLPTTTGSVEAMNRIIRDLMRQTRSVRSPQALQLWATALIRMRPTIMCNGKHFQQKKFV